MNPVSIDLETFSTCDLKKAGLWRYAEHPSTEILCASYQFHGGPLILWVPQIGLPDAVLAGFKARRPEVQLLVQTQTPRDLAAHILANGQVRAFNAPFERAILLGSAGKKVGFPPLAVAQMRCTMAKARAAGLPASLEDACTALGTRPKKATGLNDMRTCSKPRRGETERHTPENDPERFVRLYDYCCDDTLAERDLDEHLPDLSPGEQAVWEFDQTVNQRGWKVDLGALANVQELIAARKTELSERCFEITQCAPTQTGKLAGWVRANGFPQLENLQAETVNKAQRDSECPALVREVLSAYSAHNMKAVSKFSTMSSMACADGRLRGLFIYHGAGTGRWSSVGVQLQNMSRGYLDEPNTAIEVFGQRDLGWVRFLYPGMEPMRVFASTTRGMLIADTGKDLLSLDYAGIESRFTAWMFDEKWKLRAFEAFDAGTGVDLYKQSYAHTFGIPVEEVTDGQRQVGKVLELAFGFEGGVGACATAAAAYNIDLGVLVESVWPRIPSDVMEKSIWMHERFGHTVDLDRHTYLGLNALKEMWRLAHPKHVQGWKDMREAAILAIDNRGKCFQIPSKRIMFKMEDDWLLLRLPSGRKIRYYKPEVEYDEERSIRNARITYLGVDTDTRRWMRTGTYGGKLTENAAQGGSSCLLRHGVLALEAARYPIVATIHDEAVAEVDRGFGSLDAAKAIFTSKPSWAAGLPVAAEGWRGKRYRK